jgi:hypothetical protein
LAPKAVNFPLPDVDGFGHSKALAMEVLTMSKQHVNRRFIVIVLVGFATAVMSHMGIALGDEGVAPLTAPTIEYVGGHRRTDGLQLKQTSTVDSRPQISENGSPGTKLLLVSSQSCRASQWQAPLSAIPLVGSSSNEGEWVLLAGLGWNKKTDFGAKGPILIETKEGQEPANWYFTVEMLFIPKGPWHIRASMAIDADELHDTLAAPGPKFSPLHIGVAIDFDHHDHSPLVLNLGYGRMPLEGRVLSAQPKGMQPEKVLTETQVFSACLNIQW